MFEDAFMLRDRDAVAALFEGDGLLSCADGSGVGAQIRPFATNLFDRDIAYVADPRRILQARGLALVLAERSISVMRRTPDGDWQYAIKLLDPELTTSASSR